jgi:carboxypeptidase C (cathepsin A)
MDGLFKENGPILFPNNVTTPQPNKYSWTKLANVLYGKFCDICFCMLLD